LVKGRTMPPKIYFDKKASNRASPTVPPATAHLIQSTSDVKKFHTG
jgi:hypothetical protein